MFSKRKSLFKAVPNEHLDTQAPQTDPGLQIENGVVIKYTRHENELVIPDGVTEIGSFAI